jgi:hypothetical protein
MEREAPGVRQEAMPGNAGKGLLPVGGAYCDRYYPGAVADVKENSMCNCIEEVEKKLSESGRNTKLDIPITFSATHKMSANRVTISTCKRDEKKREKPLRMFAAHCPFCGLPYEEDDAADVR